MSSHQEITRVLADVFENLSPADIAMMVGLQGQGNLMIEAICKRAERCIVRLADENTKLQQQVKDLQAKLEEKQADVNTGVVHQQDPFVPDSKYIELKLSGQHVVWNQGGDPLSIDSLPISEELKSRIRILASDFEHERKDVYAWNKLREESFQIAIDMKKELPNWEIRWYDLLQNIQLRAKFGSDGTTVFLHSAEKDQTFTRQTIFG